MLDSFSKRLLVFGSLSYLLLTLFSLHLPFFWDTTLTSNIAQWFYENGVGNLLPPTEWDAGHPTFFQIYIALIWKFFGKTLVVTHWIMFPFLLISLFFYLLIINELTSSNKVKTLSILFFLFHPYILTQATLISYDTVQITFFLITLYGIIQKEQKFLWIGILGLSTCSIRGQVMAVAMCLSYFFIYIKSWKRNIFRVVVALLPIAVWHYYHYLQTGWFLSTPSELWSGQREVASFTQVFKNLFSISRAFFDYGMLGLTLVLGFVFLRFGFRFEQAAGKKILIVTLALTLFLILPMLFSTNPIGHRYFIPIHIGMLLLLLTQWEKLKKQSFAFTFILICFLTGHFWLYPKKISNGWDVSLSYIIYEKNRKELTQYLAENNISFSEIASSFPLFNSLKQTNLLEDNTRMHDITEMGVIDAKYIAYSSVCNDMRDVMNFEVLKDYERVRQFGLYAKTSIILYKRK